MITSDELAELQNLVSGKTIRKFRSDMKKEYKLALCGMFGDILKFGQYKRGRFYSIVTSLAADPESFKQLAVRVRSQDTLYGFYLINEHFFYNIDDQKYLDSVLNFFRDYLLNYERKKKRLYLVSDIQKIYDIKNFFLKRGVKVKDHNWMDINFSHQVTLTIPEFFNYVDVINIWNELISVYHQKLREQNLIEAKKLDFRFSTSTRQLVISSITFFECFLYYYLYNLKCDNNLDENHPVKKVIEQDGYIQDKQIVKQVIYKLHQHIKSDRTVKQLYKRIQEHIKLRDRFIHNSAFIDMSNQLSQMEPLMRLGVNEVMDIAQDCIDIVIRIDELLPENEKILFWWDQFETPNFKKKKYISPLNKNKEQN
ncbi:hypothetical protein MOC71_03275 [Bacillus vallismortis]|uniref:Uncharacterized protein n=1 Tax=Bacillus vallismortis TaxID=72361 RepID=A0AAP3CFV9_BACVA|nr:hypothetical protein [Bacillus vallismortis]MCY8315789.1 hypothetical protein [Bacillus vallismortis]